MAPIPPLDQHMNTNDNTISEACFKPLFSNVLKA